MGNQSSDRVSRYMVARLQWEVDEFQGMADKHSSIIQYARHGTRFFITLSVPSIRYATRELVGLYHAGSVFRLGTYDVKDSDLELAGADDPIKLAMKLQINPSGIQEPIFRVLSPVFHPHILCGSLCVGKEAWRVDQAAAWMFPYLIDLLTMQPGTYQLVSDALNPSASLYFSRSTIPFEIPLIGDRLYGQQHDA